MCKALAEWANLELAEQRVGQQDRARQRMQSRGLSAGRGRALGFSEAKTSLSCTYIDE